MRSKVLLSLILGLAMAGAVAAQAPRVVLYTGMCEASGAVPLGSGTFAVVDDDKKELRVYRKGQAAELQALDLSEVVPEISDRSDLEGGTQIGDDLYWIGSHSRNNEGKERPERHRLFAIRIESQGGRLSLRRVGKPYTDLLADLQKDSRFDKYQLACASKLPAEDPGALNIEGLSAAPNGTLFIGFRNPVRRGQALVVTLNNPRQVLDGKEPSFGAPMELDLGGLGIRSMEFWPAGQGHLIIAGSADSAGRFQAYLWSGRPDDRPRPLENVSFSGLIPEAIFFDSDASEEMIVLSDEGDACFDPEAFRSRRIPLSRP